MIPGLHEAVQRMDHAAFAHIYIVWASENHQAPVPQKEDEADIQESWLQITDILGIALPKVFLSKLTEYWKWVLHSLATEGIAPSAAAIRELLSGKIGQETFSGKSQSGILLRLSPTYKKLSKLLGNLSEQALTESLKKYLNKDPQLFLLCHIARDLLFETGPLPNFVRLETLQPPLRKIIETEFGTVQNTFFERMSRLWLYGLYFSGTTLTVEKRILLLEHLVAHPHLEKNTRKFSGPSQTT